MDTFESTSKDEYNIDSETASSNYDENSLKPTNKLNKKFSNLTDNLNRKSSVITFKRTNPSHNQTVTEHTLSKQTHEKQINNLTTDLAKNNSNKKKIRNILFKGLKSKPKRLDSQISGTGTDCTYLSYSGSSTGTPSPRISKETTNTNFNYYEEQEELLTNMNASFFHSSGPSRSNSNSTHSSELVPGSSYDSNRCSIYKNQRSTTQNSGD